ncbi:MAG TPA: hypothetical protein PLC42_06685 [Parachlamydiaceae bacterium]|nr:hypothetical protein [Parachlamydiaceae bacterium]
MIEKISSLQNSLVKHLVHLRQNHDYREEHKSVAVSGIKLVNEILPVRPLKTLLVLNESLIPQGVKKEKVFFSDRRDHEKGFWAFASRGHFSRI